MATPSQNKDRRSERTRQMLRQAFLEVVREKGLTKANVQDIVDRANVSRGTFYAHYADKYALIEVIIREEFQRNLSNLPTAAEWTRQTLHLLIQTVLEYFKSIYKRHHRSRDIGPVMDKTIQDEMALLLLAWLKAQPQTETGLPLETLAQIISWTIYGAALQWSLEAKPLAAEQMATEVLRLIMDGLAKQIPNL